MRCVAVLVLLMAACLHDDLVLCDNGVLCPNGTRCDAVHATCVSPEQTTACNGLVDGDVCTADGKQAICDQGTCVPGCGDGAQGPGEECDDGNFASHDGCSSTCLRELASWTKWESPWQGRSGQVAGYLPTSDTLVIATGADSLGEHDVQWTRDAARNWVRGTSALGRRSFAASAVDPVRNRLVVFGGRQGIPVLGDTWEYDGTQWMNVTPASGPTPRLAAAMAYDKVRSRIVMFGGRDASTIFDETWEWDGTAWTKVTTSTAPSPRYQVAFAWDTPGQRAILFGGQTSGAFLSDTWEYKAGTWTELAPTSRPAARYASTMEELPGLNALVLFGGLFSAAASDTWHFSGNTWTIQPSIVSPAGRYAASLVHAGDRLVLVGGRDNYGEVLDDVWEYDVTSWHERSPRFAPEPRSVRVVYDPARHTIVMNGGLFPNGVAPNETWLFDGTAWTLRGPAGFSPYAWAYGTTFDSTRERVILFGGFGGDGIAQSDTWLWDGQMWTKTDASGPSERTYAGLADVARDGTVVLFGGRAPDISVLRDTWEYDGITWSQRSTPADLVAPSRPGMAYDPKTERAYLVDGNGVTWTFGEHTWERAATQGAPPVRNAAVTAYDAWRGRIIRFGGSDGDTAYGDLWELVGDTWQEVPLYGPQPPVRATPALAPLPEARGLVLYDGVGSGDTWILRFSSVSPDEDCANGIDDDGDRRVDATDPDCAL
jgi:cysteine-rich repeat protein